MPDEDRCPSPTPVITVNDVPALPAEDDGQLKMGSETDVGGGSIDSPTDSNGVTAAAAQDDEGTSAISQDDGTYAARFQEGKNQRPHTREK